MIDRPTGKLEESEAPPSQGSTQKFIEFLGHNRKYWIAPAIIILVLIGLLMLVSGSRVAPFTYPPL